MKNGHPPNISADESTPTADAVLVRRFVNCGDESAFAELVARYRGLVYGVCQRVLRHRQDVEDAFQAAFLVLARDAAEIRSRESIAAWLYGVAHRIALNARAKKSRRRETTLLHETEIMGPPNPFTELAERSELQALDEELNQLPEKYREPLVLHYLMNRTAPQIAEELALSQSAVEGRLKRGRNRLRKQLARRGIGLTAILPVLQLCQSSVEASISETLVSQTVQAGLSYSSGTHTPAGHSHPVTSNEAANLAAKEIGTMTTSSLGTFTVVALSATVVIGLAIGVAGQTPAPGQADTTGLTNLSLDQDKSQQNKSPAIPVIRLAAVKTGAAGKPPAKPASLEDVLRKRLKILEQFVKLVRAVFRSGAADESAVLKAEIDVLNAKLELARTPAERVTIRKEILNHVRKLEALVKQAFARGAIDREGVFRSELRQLQAEADLLREQAGLKRKSVSAQGTRSPKGGTKTVPLTALDYKSRTLTEKIILEALDTSTQVDFVETSLRDAVEFIADHHKITILIDEKALKDEGITRDVTITMSLKDLQLKSVLRIMLNRLELDYLLKNEVLQITTKQVADEFLETRVYGTKQLRGIDAKEVVEMIEKSIAPDSWNAAKNNGKGAVTALPLGLVVTNNQRVHEKIVDLLEQLGRLSPTTEMFYGGRKRKSGLSKRSAGGVSPPQ